MMVLWFLLACGAEPVPVDDPTAGEASVTSEGPWTVEAALAPILETLDANGDRRVNAVEYRRVQGAAPSFRHLDSDRDGALSISELHAMVESLDPQTWDGNRPRRPVSMEVWRGMFPGELKIRQLSELMRFVRSEVAVGAPGKVLPSNERIQTAAETGELESEAIRSVFEDLKKIHNPLEEPQ